MLSDGSWVLFFLDWDKEAACHEEGSQYDGAGQHQGNDAREKSHEE